MSRIQVLFSICTIAVSLYAIPAKAGNHPFQNFNHKKFSSNSNGRNFQTNNFNQFSNTFVKPHKFNNNVFFTNQHNFVPKHKKVNPFFVPTFQPFVGQHLITPVPPHLFKKQHIHNNFNHFGSH